MVRTGATVADACAEYLRYIEQDRQRKPRRGPVARAVARWAAHDIDPHRRLTNRTRKTITVFHGLRERARHLHKLPDNPVADIEKPARRLAPRSTSSRPEEILALVRAANSDQDAAIYLKATFTGLCQGELVALRWRDVDF
jgi:integrase